MSKYEIFKLVAAFFKNSARERMPFEIDDYPTATSGVAEENNVFDEPTYSSSVSMKFPFLIFLLFIYLFFFSFFFFLIAQNRLTRARKSNRERERKKKKKEKRKNSEKQSHTSSTRKERLFKLNSRIYIWLANFGYKSISNINKLFVHQKLLLGNVYHTNEENRWSEFAIWHGFR